MAKDELARGIPTQGRSKSYKRRGIYFLKKKNGGKFPQHEKQQKPEAAAKAGPKFYPAGLMLRSLLDDTMQLTGLKAGRLSNSWLLQMMSRSL